MGAIALTFDCGYGAASLNRILATLADAGVHATFFLEGNWVERSPQVVAPIVAGGHAIGSHSYSHPDFTIRTQPQVTSELTKTASLVAAAGGPASLSLFRYPYGARSAETDAWVTAQGYTIVGWSIDPQGWKQSTTSDQVLAAVLRDAKPGGVVLMHCGSVGDEGALAQVIASLRARGYALVTVPELLGTTTVSAN
jgi:peptidoglycan/xylan/chitin deacetylase (PgdA/CDA1 family)